MLFVINRRSIMKRAAEQLMKSILRSSNPEGVQCGSAGLFHHMKCRTHSLRCRKPQSLSPPNRFSLRPRAPAQRRKTRLIKHKVFANKFFADMDKGSARNSERFEHPHALRIQSGAKPNFIFAIRKPAGRFRDSRASAF